MTELSKADEARMRRYIACREQRGTLTQASRDYAMLLDEIDRLRRRLYCYAANAEHYVNLTAENSHGTVRDFLRQIATEKE